MKKTLSLLLLLIAANNGFAQTSSMSYQYMDNKEDFNKQSDFYKPKSSGAQYCTKVAQFKAMANRDLKSFMSRAAMINYTDKLIALSNRAGAVDNSNTAAKLKAFAQTIKELSPLSGDDDYRFALYKFSYPVYRAVDEAWEDDIVRAMLADGHLELVDYITANNLVRGDLKDAMAVVDKYMLPVTQSNDECTYSVNIDAKVTRDKIDVFFCDDALFRKATSAYNGRLLFGPILDWKDRKGESETVMTMLNSHATLPSHQSYYVYGYPVATQTTDTKLEQKVQNNMDWHVLVFRNNCLYYSYMVTPCSKLNMCKIH